MLPSKSRLLSIAITSVACNSERRPRGDASAFSPDPCGVDGSEPCGPSSSEERPENSVIEIEDDWKNSTLAPCETGTIKSPGADIDSAELNAGNFLLGCQLTGTTACENDSASASQAEGAPDATGQEETGTYTSLNGGVLRCRWSNEAAVFSSDSITVIEIGGNSDTTVEQYRIRLCDLLSGECQRNSAYASGEASFLGWDLF